MDAFRKIAALILLAQALFIAGASPGIVSRLPLAKKAAAGELWIALGLVSLLFLAGAWQVFKGKGRWFAWMASLPLVFVSRYWPLRLVASIPVLFLLTELVAPWIQRRRGKAANEQTEKGSEQTQRQIIETGAGIGVLMFCGWLFQSAPGWMTPAVPEDSDPGWLSFGAGLWISILVHELGHAVGGAAMDFHLTRIAVFPFDYTRTSKRSYFRINPAVLGGFYLGLPRHLRNLEFRHLLMTAAGPASGFLFSFACWLSLWLANGSLAGFGFDAVNEAMRVSFSMNVLNLLPLRFGGIRLDGLVIWNSLLRRPDREPALGILSCCSSQYTSLRPRDWAPEWIETLRGSPDPLATSLLMVSAEDRLLESPGDEQALSDLGQCSAAVDWIAKKWGNAAASAFVFHRAWIRCRYGGITTGAEALIPAAKLDPETEPHEILRLEAALRAAEGDARLAREIVGRAEKMLTARPSLNGFDTADLESLRAFGAELDAQLLAPARPRLPRAQSAGV